MFALIDCNNFFVSCERLFRPDLENHPVVVLSSNDGCAISRSAEAKALGIPMGAPAFKYKDLFQKHDVRSLSANFELYGDISQRMTTLLSRITPHIEIYSVDESFLDLSELHITDFTAWGRELRNRILNEIGIPVSVGIAPSKTLAKLANHRAKQDKSLEGTLAITNPANPAYDRFFLETPINEVWGVGWRLTPKLKAEGIHNADDLRLLYPPRARQLMGINGVRMVAELGGLQCLPLQPDDPAPQTIMRGRTLGQEIHDEATLEAAVSTLAARAAYCLRRSNQLVRTAGLSLNTNRHKPGYRRLDANVRFTTPTADTGAICRELTEALKAIHQPQLGIYRVNVLFHELVASDAIKLDLFGEVNPAEHERSSARMHACDAINRRYGRGVIRSAAENLSDAWQPRKGACSPRYTTKWSDLPVARIY